MRRSYSHEAKELDVRRNETFKFHGEAGIDAPTKSCRVINIKQGRVGGLLEALRIAEYAAAQGVPVWSAE